MKKVPNRVVRASNALKFFSCYYGQIDIKDSKEHLSLSLSLITNVTCGLEEHEEQVIRDSHRCDQQVDPRTAGVRTVDNFVSYKEVIQVTDQTVTVGIKEN